jgi:uncharacterized YccA/Bax inhibitor family protein
MTVQGTATKTGLLLVLAVAAAILPWQIFMRSENPAAAMPFVAGGAIAGLVLALVTVFKKTWSPVTAPLYAVAEGLALGGISALFEVRFPGIVVQAVFLTMGTLLGLLLAYKSRIIRATENFKLGVFAATAGIALTYLASFIMGFFGMSFGFIHSSGTFGILFSVGVVIIAALNLVLDFDFIEQGADRGAPKYMEWYGAFGLMVTLVWLYLEILRLLSKLRDRR